MAPRGAQGIHQASPPAGAEAHGRKRDRYLGACLPSPSPGAEYCSREAGGPETSLSTKVRGDVNPKAAPEIP